MKYSLLENGVDSLKSTFINLSKLHELHEGIEHCLKDAVLSLNHSIEILFKLLLKENHEYLVFSNIDHYIDAKELMRKNGKANVFEVKPNLKTVSLGEAIRRLEFLCDYDVSSEYKAIINFLNKVRNQITHFEIDLSNEQMLELTLKLQVCYELTINFFSEYVEGLLEKLVAARFELTRDEYTDELTEILIDIQHEYDEFRGYPVVDDF